MEIILRLAPEEYNLIHKGLTKLSIEEGLSTLQKIVAQAEEQLKPKPEQQSLPAQTENSKAD